MNLSDKFTKLLLLNLTSKHFNKLQNLLLILHSPNQNKNSMITPTHKIQQNNPYNKLLRITLIRVSC
jgi:hypothetical protein